MTQQFYSNIAPDFTARHKISQEGELPYPHFHPGYEVYLCQTESVLCMFNGALVAMTDGDIMLLNSFDTHRMMPQTLPYVRTVFVFSPSFASGFSTPQTDLLACFRHGPGNAALFHLNQEQVRLMMECQGNVQAIEDDASYGADVRRKILLAGLLLHINEWIQNKKPQRSAVADEWMEGLLSYISAHPEADLSLAALAARCFQHKNRLNERFRRYTGMTVHQYVLHSRIAHARQCLLGGMSVTRTAAESGFDNLSHFIRAFKALNGVSPGRFAAEYRKLG